MIRLMITIAALTKVIRADYTDVASGSDSCTAEDVGEWDHALHITSIFVLLVTSAVGVFLPVIFGDHAGNSNIGRASFALKYFGSGIIISLAECIGKLAYEPTAPAIAMASALVMWLVDYFGSRRLARLESYTADCLPHRGPDQESKPAFADMGCCDAGCVPLEVLDGASKRAHWDVQLLEGGIVFHSIMIGVALGAQTDGFVPTFIALTFHQLFEGLGLGARIGQLKWVGGRGSSVKKWGMCTLYAIITPIGIAIGVGVHSTFNENGRSELLAIGVLNSISAGILLYSGLCQLLFAEWVAGEMRSASTARVIFGLISLGLGLFAMSLIGKWT